MRPVSGTKGNLRASALWGKKTKGEARSSALWGKPGRSMAAFLAIITVLAAPVAAPAKDGPGHNSSPGALVPDGLFARAQANPDKLFPVIVQAKAGKSSTYVANLVQGVSTKGKCKAKGVKKKFSAVNGVAGTNGNDLGDPGEPVECRRVQDSVPVPLPFRPPANPSIGM